MRYLRSPSNRLLALTAGAAVGLAPLAASADVSDPFGSVPSRETMAPHDNSAQTAPLEPGRDGALPYAFDITLPPGRAGFAPSLSLRYASSAPLRGTLAAGWSLSLPSVTRDLSRDSEAVYLADLGGGALRLVPAPEDITANGGVAYRARQDDFTRFEAQPAGTDLFNAWRARTTDGRTLVFGGAVFAASDFQTRWNVTQETDLNGNTIDYDWSLQGIGGYVDWVPQEIRYGANTAAGIAHFAKVAFTYAPVETCPGSTLPIGASVQHRGGVLSMHGSRRLTEIVVSVRDTLDAAYREVRRVKLSYDAQALSCGGQASPMRYLKQIDETVTSPTGASRDAPPTTFTYGASAPTFSATNNIPSPGYGATGDRWGTITELMDIDGDGLLDHLTMVTGQKCTLEVRSGTFGGGFSKYPTIMTLPTAAWHSPDGPSPYEWCRMEGQHADRTDDVCAVEVACVQTSAKVSYTFLDWNADGRMDIIAHAWGAPDQMGPDFPQIYPTVIYADTGNGSGTGSPTTGCGNQGYPDSNGDCYCPAGYDSGYDGCEAHCWGRQTLLGCEEDTSGNPPGSGGPGNPNGVQFPTLPFFPPEPERGSAAGTFRWRVFLGSGTSFDYAGAISDAPLPLDLGGGLSATDALGRPVLPVFADVNGDGLPDVVTTPLIKLEDVQPTNGNPTPGGLVGSIDPAKTVGSGNTLLVYLHTGLPTPQSSGLAPKVEWSLPIYSQVDAYAIPYTVPGIGWPGGYPDHVNSFTPVTFSDVDGDGLPDLIANDNAGQLGVVWNRGGSFGSGFTPFPRAGVSPPSPTVSVPLVQKNADVWLNGFAYEEGVRGTVSTPMDLDADGLPDQLVMGAKYGDVRLNPASVWTGYLNLGAGPSLSAAMPSGWEAAKSLLVAKDGYWKRTSDVIDLNGDGVPDQVTWTKTNGGIGAGFSDGTTLSPYIASLHTEPGDAGPLRLLSAIQNGRGAVTSITYAPTSNPLVVDRGGEPLPQIRWVVRSLVDSPGGEQPALARTFSYAEPIRGMDDPLDRIERFRGFGRTTVDEGPMRRTVSHVGGLGQLRLLEEEKWVAPGPGAPLGLAHDVVHGYAAASMLGGECSFTYESDTTDHSCDVGQTPASCKATDTNARSVHHEWQGVPLPSGAVGFLVDTLMSESMGGATPTRITSRQYATWNAGADYRVVLTSEQVTTPNGDIWAKTSYEDLDAQHRPRKTRVSSALNVDSITTRTLDAAGNVSSVKRPNQAAVANGPVIATSYDSFGLYPKQIVNELGHVVLQTTDLGTGVLLKREGPDFRMVAPPSCASPPCAQVKSYSPESFVIDGFGRVLEHRVASDPPSGTEGYVIFTAESSTYDDLSIPNHKTTMTKLDYTGVAVRTTVQTLDGRGRILSSVASGGAGSTPAITAYQYDAAGALAAIEQPDPRDDAATVTFTFARDGAGRVTSFTRPDGSSSSISYGPLETVVQEWSAAGVTGQKTKQVRDLFDRLTSVVEYDNPSLGATATTKYTYDPLGRTTRIVDPDGVITDATYDRVGRRRSVTRGSRRWVYVYDLDGNLVQRRSPLPTPNADAALYTWTNVYDKLDRLTQHTPAAGNLSAADRTALAVVPTQYIYDTSPNGIGKLAQAKWSYGTKTFYYDVHNRPNIEIWSINVPANPTFGIQQSVTRSFTPSGLLRTEKWDNSSQWALEYDFQDRPTKVQWYDPSPGVAAWKNVAVYTRSAAGAPRSRTSDYASSRSWQYDVLGRVTSDTILAGAVTKSSRGYVYDGFGNLIGVSGQTDGASASAGYTYDTRHRLATAAGPGAYAGQFSYSASGNVKRATISGAGDTPARDAKYSYGAMDPQAVDALTNFATNAAIASFSYDFSGNMISRSSAAGSAQLVWDGDDQLRKVVGPAGTERYLHDQEGQRILAIRSDGVTFWAGDNETRYSAGGAVQTRWMTLSAGEPVARVENKTSIEIQYADALGSVILTTSPQGATTGSFLYGAFGEIVTATGESSHPVQFQGKPTDALTGLHYHGARYYDPLTLRWISADPLYRAIPDGARKEPQRGNWYAFNLNNAIHYTDPDGRDPGTLPIVEKFVNFANAWHDASEQNARAMVLSSRIGEEKSKLIELFPKQYAADKIRQKADAAYAQANQLIHVTFTGDVALDPNDRPKYGALIKAVTELDAKSDAVRAPVTQHEARLKELEAALADPSWNPGDSLQLSPTQDSHFTPQEESDLKKEQDELVKSGKAAPKICVPEENNQYRCQ